jgi:hypothetical protein
MFYQSLELFQRKRANWCDALLSFAQISLMHIPAYVSELPKCIPCSCFEILHRLISLHSPFSVYSRDLQQPPESVGLRVSNGHPHYPVPVVTDFLLTGRKSYSFERLYSHDAGGFALYMLFCRDSRIDVRYIVRL